MGVLNVRGLDDGLIGLVKAEAARRRVTLRELVAEYLALCVPAVGDRSPAVARVPAKVESRVVAQVATVEPLARVREVVKAKQAPNYLDMKPSEALRARREAEYRRTHPND